MTTAPTVSVSVPVSSFSSSFRLSRQSVDDYDDWLYLMESLLVRKKEWNESLKVPKDTPLAHALIVELLNLDIIALIKHTKSAPVIWELLKDKFCSKSISNQVSCIKALCSFKFFNDPQDSFTLLNRLLTKLKRSIGDSKIDVDVLGAMILLNSLPDGYVGVKAVLENSSEISLPQIESKIVTTIVKTPQVFLAADQNVSDHCQLHKSRFNKTFPKSQCFQCHPELRPVCIKCKELGAKSYYHEFGSRKCPFNDNKLVQAYSCFSMSPSPSKWVLDSGGTDHLTNKNILQNKTGCSFQIGTASSGQGLICSETGSFHAKFGDNNVSLENVLYCKNLSANLLSVSKFDSNGYSTLFHKGKCFIMSNTNDLLDTVSTTSIIHDSQDNGLYYIDFSSGNSLLAAQSSPVTFDTWHSRLGHLNFKDMTKLPKLVKGFLLSNGVVPKDCSTCIINKSKRVSFSVSDSRSNSVGELTHIDIGVMPCFSISGYKYYLLLVDDFSRYVTIHCIRHKSDSANLIKQYSSIIFNKTGGRPMFIRSDNALEFFTSDLIKFNQEMGTIMQSTSDFTPEQNGVCERMNQTIVDMGRSMLQASNAPDKLWEYALESAVYVRNRCPQSSNPFNITAYELFHKKSPNISNLRVFGELCYIHIHQRHKLDPKAAECIFVGYGEVKPYRVPERKAIPEDVERFTAPPQILVSAPLISKQD